MTTGRNVLPIVGTYYANGNGPVRMSPEGVQRHGLYGHLNGKTPYIISSPPQSAFASQQQLNLETDTPPMKRRNADDAAATAADGDEDTETDDEDTVYDVNTLSTIPEIPSMIAGSLSHSDIAELGPAIKHLARVDEGEPRQKKPLRFGGLVNGIEMKDKKYINLRQQSSYQSENSDDTFRPFDVKSSRLGRRYILLASIIVIVVVLLIAVIVAVIVVFVKREVPTEKQPPDSRYRFLLMLNDYNNVMQNTSSATFQRVVCGAMTTICSLWLKEPTNVASCTANCRLTRTPNAGVEAEIILEAVTWSTSPDQLESEISSILQNSNITGDDGVRRFLNDYQPDVTTLQVFAYNDSPVDLNTSYSNCFTRMTSKMTSAVAQSVQTTGRNNTTVYVRTSPTSTTSNTSQTSRETTKALDKYQNQVTSSSRTTTAAGRTDEDSNRTVSQTDRNATYASSNTAISTSRSQTRRTTVSPTNSSNHTYTTQTELLLHTTNATIPSASHRNSTASTARAQPNVVSTELSATVTSLLTTTVNNK